jgi:hypothetical protein
MRSFLTTPKPTTAGWLLAMGCFLLPIACNQPDGNGGAAPALAPERKAVAATVTPSLPPSSQEDLASFARTLTRKLDPAQETTRVASPEGGILNIPNGHVAHASVLVRGADGKLRSACVSSAAEVTALVKQSQSGAQP